MKLDHLSKETFHDIKTVLEEEQKALLTANNNIIEQRLLFEGENNHTESRTQSHAITTTRASILTSASISTT